MAVATLLAGLRRLLLQQMNMGLILVSESAEAERLSSYRDAHTLVVRPKIKFENERSDVVISGLRYIGTIGWLFLLTTIRHLQLSH